jgi:hypothetical protein
VLLGYVGAEAHGSHKLTDVRWRSEEVLFG